MRVVVDGRSLTTGRGVARFVRCVLDALAPAAPDVELVAVVPGRAPLAGAPAGVRLVRTALPSQAVFGAAALTGRPRLDRLAGGADVVWVPAPAPVAVSAGVPVVLTVHDRAWEHRPADYTRYERLFHRLARPRATAARAAAVTAVSAAVRDDVAAAWSLDPARLHVVHPGPGLPRAPARGPGRRPGAGARPAVPPRGGRARAPQGARGARRGLPARRRGRPRRRPRRGRLRSPGRGPARRPRDPPGGRRRRPGARRALRRGPRARAPRAHGGLRPAAARGGACAASPRRARTCRRCARRSGTPRCSSPPGDAGALAAALVRLGADPALRDRLGAAAARARRGASRGSAPRPGCSPSCGRRPGERHRRRRHARVGAPTCPPLLGSVATHLGPRDPQVVVVDSGSTDGSPDLAAAAGAEVVRLDGNPGFGAANDAGVERARHDVTILLNPDCELRDDGLLRLADEARGRDALLVPRLLNTDGSVQRSAHPRPGTAAGLVAALVPPRALPRARARGARALPQRPAAPGRVGDRRLRRRAHGAPAAPGPLRPRRVPLLRGPRPLPARGRGRRADRAAARRRRRPPRLALDRAGVRGRGVRAPGPAATRRRRRPAGASRAGRRRRRAGADVRPAGARRARARQEPGAPAGAARRPSRRVAPPHGRHALLVRRLDGGVPPVRARRAGEGRRAGGLRRAGQLGPLRAVVARAGRRRRRG